MLRFENYFFLSLLDPRVPAVVAPTLREKQAKDRPPALDDPGHQALPAGLGSGAKNRDLRPGAVRSDDAAITALGSQSTVVDVRTPAAITYITADANVSSRLMGGCP